MCTHTGMHIWKLHPPYLREVMKMNDSDHGSWACRNGASAGLSVVNRTPLTSELKWEVFRFLYTCLHWETKDMKVPCFSIRKWLVGFLWDPFLLVIPIPSHCCNPKFHFLASFNIYQSCKSRQYGLLMRLSVSVGQRPEIQPHAASWGVLSRDFYSGEVRIHDFAAEETFHESLWSLLESDENTGLWWALRERIRHT